MSDALDFLCHDDPPEPINLIMSRLVEILGSRLCALIGDVQQTGTVREWVEGKEPTGGRSRIFRFALRVASTIEQQYGSAAAQSWFQGANLALADESPALALRRATCAVAAEAISAERQVKRALRAFLDI